MKGWQLVVVGDGPEDFEAGIVFFDGSGVHLVDLTRDPQHRLTEAAGLREHNLERK